MKAAGIIAEYNPLHNGHIYHMEQTRLLTGADAVVVAMSGDFVQRGEPALMDKWTRTELALKAGADLVIEIPVLSCLGNAGQYAAAGVALLESLGKVSHISFGSECGDLEMLRSVTGFIRENGKELAEEVRKLTKNGYNYPVARAHAYRNIRMSEGTSDPAAVERELAILESSNDILAMEYISSMKSAVPVAVRREGAGYSQPYDQKFSYQSASAIRAQLADGRSMARYVPEYTDEAVKSVHLTWPDSDRWFDTLRYAVMTFPAEYIEDCPSGGEGLANLMKSRAKDAPTLTGFVRRVKSKRYTYTRISRLCMQLLLGITRTAYPDQSVPGYIRVLGFTDKGRELLSEIRKEESAELPVITNIGKSLPGLDEQQKRLLELDIHASDIYNLMTGRDLSSESDYLRSPVMI